MHFTSVVSVRCFAQPTAMVKSGPLQKWGGSGVLGSSKWKTRFFVWTVDMRENMCTVYCIEVVHCASSLYVTPEGHQTVIPRRWDVSFGAVRETGARGPCRQTKDCTTRTHDPMNACTGSVAGKARLLRGSRWHGASWIRRALPLWRRMAGRLGPPPPPPPPPPAVHCLRS